MPLAPRTKYSFRQDVIEYRTEIVDSIFDYNGCFNRKRKCTQHIYILTCGHKVIRYTNTYGHKPSTKTYILCAQCAEEAGYSYLFE